MITTTNDPDLGQRCNHLFSHHHNLSSLFLFLLLFHCCCCCFTVVVVGCQKRLSAITLSLAGKVTTPTDLWPEYGGGGSVPPSPLRRDFTCEPPWHAQPMYAIRKLNFQFPPGAVEGGSGRDGREGATDPSAGRKVCGRD